MQPDSGSQVEPAKAGTRVEPGQRASEAAVVVLERQATVVEANLPGCVDDTSIECLHDLRVAVRRSRSVLRQLWRVFPRDRRKAQARNLRWIQAVTGPTRDLDVQLREWETLVAGLPAEDREALSPATEQLRAGRAQEFAAMQRKLSGKTFDKRWAAWRAFLTSDSSGEDVDRPKDAGRPIEEVVTRRVRSLHRRMLKEGGKIGPSSPATELHELRKRGKELRYLLELFGDVLPESSHQLVGPLKDLQDALGDHQDLEVQVGSLRSLEAKLPEEVGGARGDNAARALELVIDRLYAGQRQARDSYADRFRTFAAVRFFVET